MPQAPRAQKAPLKLRTKIIMAACLALPLIAAGGYAVVKPKHVLAAIGWVRATHTVETRLTQFGPQVAARLAPAFSQAGISYPPSEVAFLAFKDSRQLALYARNTTNAPWQWIKNYAVLGASGQLGPKLKEGDYQVPEGLYTAEFLNPNSRFHVSIRLNYPNAFDQRMAQADARVNLGGDIMIHGSKASVGCLAMGDDAAEELFTLAALAGKARVKIIVSPTDFRQNAAGHNLAVQPPWVPALYQTIAAALGEFPIAP